MPAQIAPKAFYRQIALIPDGNGPLLMRALSMTATGPFQPLTSLELVLVEVHQFTYTVIM